MRAWGCALGRVRSERSAPRVPFRPRTRSGSSRDLGRFQDADSALAARGWGLGRAAEDPKAGLTLFRVREPRAAGAGYGTRRSSRAPVQPGGARPGAAAWSARDGGARTRRSGIGCNRWGQATANGRSPLPVPSSSPPLPPSPLHLLPPRRPPPRRSWKRPAAGWSRHRSRSTAAATWCRGRSTASSPSSSSTSCACRSARRCGTAWPRAAGSGRGGLGAGSSGAGRVGARTRRGMARPPAGSPGLQPSALLSFLVAGWLHHSRPELSLAPETHLWAECVPGAPSLFSSSLRDIWSALWGTAHP